MWVLVTFFADRNHAAVGYLTLDVLKLNGGVVDAEASEQTFFYFAQNALAG